ncbi:unnamed protein product [Fasciola hepatica]|uniref:Uncharacterized protein n=1 Tax=Fasciola hepatica TaxID=6192 RepID=A0ABC9HIW5_FASHE
MQPGEADTGGQSPTTVKRSSLWAFSSSVPGSDPASIAGFGNLNLNTNRDYLSNHAHVIPMATDTRLLFELPPLFLKVQSSPHLLNQPLGDVKCSVYGSVH